MPETEETCESGGHDFRRVYASDVFGKVRTRKEGTVLAVLCRKCGRSPRAFFTDRVVAHGGYSINGDWPFNYIITNYYDDEEKGPSVEFYVEERADG